MSITDAALVELVRGGSHAGYAAIVGRYRDAVYAIAYSRLHDRHDAEDVAQETFVQAFFGLASLRNPARLGHWLCGIARNQALNWANRRRSRAAPLSTVSGSLRSPAKPPDRLAEDAEVRDIVSRAIQALPEKQRESTMLYYIDGYSQGEVASMLGVPLGTVKRRLHDARRRMKGELWSMMKDELDRSKPKEEFTARVLEEARKRSQEAGQRWAKEDFLRSTGDALAAAEGLSDADAQIEILTMRAEARSTWVGEPDRALEDYQAALAVARRELRREEELTTLKRLIIAYLRGGGIAEARTRAGQALALAKARGDRENEAFAAAAEDLCDTRPPGWEPGKPGGFVLAVFPVVSDETGRRFLDPVAERHVSWGAPSRAAALAYLLQPRRFLGPSLEPNAAWEHPIEHARDMLTWGLGEDEKLVARSTVASKEAVVVTPAGRFTGCFQVVTEIGPMAGGPAPEFTARTYAGRRTACYAPGIGLVKLRHEDANDMVHRVYLEAFEGSGVRRTWRYCWHEAWQPEHWFRDTCRLVSDQGDKHYISSAIWTIARSPEDVEKALEDELRLEEQAQDLAGEAAVLKQLVYKTKDAAMKETRVNRLLALYEKLGDRWNLQEMHHARAARGEQSLPEALTGWLHERVKLARQLGDARKLGLTLMQLGYHLAQNGEHERATATLEEGAKVLLQEGYVRDAAQNVAMAEMVRLRLRASAPPGTTYVTGEAVFIQGRDGAITSNGSGRSSYGPPPSQIAGTPMTDILWNEPFHGSKLFGRETGASTSEKGNTGVPGLKEIVETMSTVSILAAKDDEVAVPAGRFSGCTRIETTISTSAEDLRVGPELDRVRGYYAGIKTTWFAPGVGLARMLYRHANGRTTDAVLLDYEVKGSEKDPDATGPEVNLLPLEPGNRWRYSWADQETGTAYEDSLRVAGRRGDQWFVAFATAASPKTPAA